ncbi:hypothetical protein GUITHDRAFT_135216 [Guillardia theta CCMP2712]|uniref:Uncharacterized protein n=1 Tax=Guillardia theta (strain CCMP2712) TaxID=905079 RepID=L1JR62_GUITC|nr:hypothetical protein GUITHDRAFT_135216 [Guillardia theta CCMP2712]EKX50583.1 hypothetical protein GUITHDRAFT_135216 [Guillardia theta CCMP2712]|eukprot:XP_005837563.1 hypothetical protein GUITHDRAFT_135216 [Guillardia theta CCMP2712]
MAPPARLVAAALAGPPRRPLGPVTVPVTESTSDLKKSQASRLHRSFLATEVKALKVLRNGTARLSERGGTLEFQPNIFEKFVLPQALNQEKKHVAATWKQDPLLWEADLDWKLQQVEEERRGRVVRGEERLRQGDKYMAPVLGVDFERERLRHAYAPAETRAKTVEVVDLKRAGSTEAERQLKLLDRHASIRAASARIVSSSHARAVTRQFEEETRRVNLPQVKGGGGGAGGGGWGVQVQLPPLPISSYPPILSQPQDGSMLDLFRSAFLPVAESALTGGEARSQMVQTSPRILASPRLPLAGGAASDWLFGSRWQWSAGGQAEGVAELCVDGELREVAVKKLRRETGSFKAPSAGQHAHWWLDEQGRLNVEWGNRLGLHVLVVDKGRGRLTGMRSNGKARKGRELGSAGGNEEGEGNVPVEAQLLRDQREQDLPPAFFSPRVSTLPLIHEDSRRSTAAARHAADSRRSEESGSLEWSSMLNQGGEESGDAGSGSPRR